MSTFTEDGCPDLPRSLVTLDVDILFRRVVLENENLLFVTGTVRHRVLPVSKSLFVERERGAREDREKSWKVTVLGRLSVSCSLGTTTSDNSVGRDPYFVLPLSILHLKFFVYLL